VAQPDSDGAVSKERIEAALDRLEPSLHEAQPRRSRHRPIGQRMRRVSRIGNHPSPFDLERLRLNRGGARRPASAKASDTDGCRVRCASVMICGRELDLTRPEHVERLAGRHPRTVGRLPLIMLRVLCRRHGTDEEARVEALVLD
jgi:hypothetical protein